MKYNKLWKRTGAWVLCAAMFGNGLLTGLAAEAVTTPISTYSAEEMARFADNTLEYWEIPGLIEHYNPSYLNELESYYYNPDGSTGLSKDQLKAIAADLRSEAKELEEELDDKLDSKELEKGSAGYQDYKDNIKTFKRRAKEMEDALKGSASTKRLLRIAKNQLTVDISAQMREYQMLVSQNEIQQKNLELAERTFQSAKRQAELGMYSQAQLRTTEYALAAARGQADAAWASLTQKKSELITSLGWKYGSDAEILPIPEPDLTKIAGYDLAADLVSAVNNNYDLADIRKTDSSEYGGAKKKREELDATEKSVKMQFEVLYKTVLAQEEVYKGAMTGWTSAEQKKAKADRNLALGMISSMEYLQAEIEWLTAKSSKEQAAFQLQAAMETYEWARNGLMSQSGGM